MVEPLLRMIKRPFNMGRTIKDDKQPSRMINIQYTKRGDLETREMVVAF
jgi:hypothetical protein